MQVARKPVSISSATSGNRKKRVGSSIQSQKLILKAVADADKSIAKKRKEARQKDAELEAIHKSRSKASMMAKRFKIGHLDGSKSGQDEEEEEHAVISPASEERGMGVAGVEEAGAISAISTSGFIVRFIASSTSRVSHKSLLNLSITSISRVLGSIRRL